MLKHSLYILLLLILIQYNAYSQYVWPIKNSETGKNIISKPQDLIGDELNSDGLIIGANEGAIVVAPLRGEIVKLAYVYTSSWYYLFMKNIEFSGFEDMQYFDKEQRVNLASEFQANTKYISLLIVIKTDDGIKYSIRGLRPQKYLKTGSNIKKGEIIGAVGFFYEKIKEPSIKFSMSKNSKPIDPMGVFGLATTFIPPKSDKINYLTQKHQPQKLKDDFKIFCESLIEGHPGLYDYTTKQELQKKINEIEQQLDTPMTSEEFRLKLASIISIIKDSHTSIYSKRYKLSHTSKPPVLFGLKNDTLAIYSTTDRYKKYIGKEITAINNIKIEIITPKINSILYRNDGYIKTGKERLLFLNYWMYYGQIFSKQKDDTIQLSFIDGTSKVFIYDNYSDSSYYPQIEKPFVDSVKIITKILESRIGYIKINDLVLNDLEKEQIRDFIQHISDSAYRGLIIDVRDNLGGQDEIFSYIAQEPYRESIKYRVNKKGSFELFKKSINFPKDMNLFQNYIYSNKDSSFIIPIDSIEISYPNDSINFKGKVVVLANEFSLSAATLIPALVHKYKRGVIIGRETGSGYYLINAIIFPKIALNNTGLELYFPLIQIVFDEKGKSDIPWGRGVIPDIEIPLYYGEFYGDDSKYIEAAIKVIKEKNSYYNIKKILILLSTFLILLILFFIKKSNK